MKLNMYSLYDEKAQAYNTPQIMKLHGEAIRALESMLSKDSMISKYPQDFSLYCLGTFDDNTGKIEGFNEPELVIRASDLIQVESKKEEDVSLEPVG